MEKALSQLIQISKVVGKDSSFVQGGGGNTSVKSGDGRYMYIKASGTALKDMTGRDGWRRLRLDRVLAIIRDRSIASLPAEQQESEVVRRLLITCDDKITSGVRPSVEAHLHAFLDNYVIHLHPSAVGAYVNAKDGKRALERLFKGEKYPPLWVAYADPGLILARRMAGLVEEYRLCFGRRPAILFLEKHGLLVSAGSLRTGLRLVRKVIGRCRRKLKQPSKVRIKPISHKEVNTIRLFLRRAFWTATGRYVALSYFCDNTIAAFWRQRNGKRLLSAPALTPDELLYAKGPPLWVEPADIGKVSGWLTSQIKREKRASAAFLVKGIGLFVVGRGKVALTVRDIVMSSLFIRTNASRFGGISSLNKQQQDCINQWESETYRATVLAGGSRKGEMQDRIAVVSGAGSGLGRSIAIGLARAGALVGLIDIDRGGSEETRDIIKRELPGSSVMTIYGDVTKEKDVDSVFNAILNQWGGIDILVNAAGIAPAYSLVDLPVDKWRLTLEVNLTGYFLMARAAARIMIKQKMGGNIINISSKSGLKASKDNTPYNVTKAGELHMARGWALELGKYGIRVNSVAPGNVFKGSKIWNPQYVRVCAKKYGIRPEEVIPYYINKTALKREVKGEDIAEAVIFLSSERARTITGQTLVLDSGQVMVR